MELSVWGARGSYPASGAGFSAYGHHTACLSVRVGEDLVVLDAGTGAAQLGAAFSRKPAKRVHILLSHFHHDHVMGLPFLLFGMAGQAEIAIHSALGAGIALRDRLAALFSPPFFPADPSDLFSGIRFHSHAAGERFRAGSVNVCSALLDHPGGSSAFRLQARDRAIVYATDLEASDVPQAALADLAANADLLVHDTMFTHDELNVRRGWGHSTSEAAIALAKAGRCRRLAGFHHNPLHVDTLLAKREAQLAEAMPGAFFLREGQILRL